MIKKIIQEIENSFDVLRLNEIRSAEKKDDIDFFIHEKDMPGVIRFLCEKGFVVKNNPNRGIVAYIYINGLLYDLDFADSSNSLLIFFPKRYFKENFYKDIWEDPGLEKFMRYVLQFRNQKKKYSTFVKINFEKYGQFLSNNYYLNKPIFKQSANIKDVLGIMKRNWHSIIKVIPTKTLIELFYIMVKRKLKKIGTGKIIAFVGADGSGKTTAIEKNSYICTCRVINFGDGSIYMQRIYHKMDQMPIAIARIKYLGIFIEQWFRYLRIWMLKMRGNTILTDRWPGTNRHLRNNNFWLHVNNAIYSFFPHPDLYIFLSASPILIHKRKPELSINEITRLQKNLRKKIARHNHIEIETENIDKSLTKTLKTIFDEQKKPIISC